jgi:hypothetical protein
VFITNSYADVRRTPLLYLEGERPMANCAVCGKKFSSNPLAGHSRFRKHFCGKCHSGVGKGCFTKESYQGHKVIICNRCQDNKNPTVPMPTHTAADRLVAGGRQMAEELFDGTRKKVVADANDLAERLITRIEEALTKRAKEELRVALYLWLILGAAVATVGALSLLFAWLHKAVL